MSGPEREELRLALVMNGGVSLAVWMGGVTDEIFRLVTQRHPVYAKLLDLTQTVARVDVISGTSAGGINGAALSVAMLYGGRFADLRDVWMNTGSFTDLLRPATGANPGSLLQGDEFFLPNLERALRGLIPADHRPADARTTPVDLRLSTTLLTGRQGNAIDDLGSPVNDVDYRAYFHFRHKPNTPSDFADPSTLVPRLARAARSTASFPFAFEPSRLTPENTGDHLRGLDGRVLEVPRYVIDGGVLNNKPFEGARQAIFEMRSQGSVRRVLAYINPDPGDGPPGRLGGDMPPLSRVLFDGVLGIPQSQTIADQLEAIEAHNDAVRKRRDSLLTLVRLGRDTLSVVAAELFEVYRKRRLASTFELFVWRQLADAAERRPALAAGLRGIGKRRRAEMKRAFDRFGERTLGWLPRAWPRAATDAAYDRQSWEWGLFPVEFSAKVLLDLLRMTQRMIDVGATSADGDGPEAPAARGAPGDWGDAGHDGVDAGPPAAAPAADADATTRQRRLPFVDDVVDDRRALEDAWARTYTVLEQLARLRRDEQAARWSPGAEKLLTKLAETVDAQGRPISLSARLERSLYPALFHFLGEPERRQQCAGLAYRIAETIVAVSDLALRATDRAQRDRLASMRDAERVVAADLTMLVKALGGDAHHAAADRPRETLFVLLQLEVVQFAFDDHEGLAADTLIELVQISGNGDSPLGGRSDARDKLLGLQLAHFGAFYKASWRANDWLYGRLGGSERLVKVLLNPERLHRCRFGDGRAVVAAIRDLALDSVPSDTLRARLATAWVDRGYQAAIERELAFLDDPALDLPDTLPVCASAITLRLHYGILHDELPCLIRAIHDDHVNGAEASGPGETMLRQLASQARAPDGSIRVTPELAEEWLRDGLVAKETLLGQSGSDLFTRTIAQTAATLQNTIASKATGLGPVSAFFATLKLPTLGFYLGTRGLLAQSRTGAAVNGTVLAFGVALVLMQFLWTPKELGGSGLPHVLVTVGWALLAYGLIVSVLRTPRTFTVLFAIAMYVAAVSAQSTTLLVATLTLVLVFASTRYAWLQAVTGLLAIVFAALWGSGWLASVERGPPPADATFGTVTRDFDLGVLVLAGVVCLTLVWAVFQSSSRSRRTAETFFGALGAERTGNVALGGSGVTVSIETTGLVQRRLRRVVVERVQAAASGVRSALVVGDEIVELNDRSVDRWTVDEFIAAFAHDAQAGRPAVKVRRVTREGLRVTL